MPIQTYHRVWCKYCKEFTLHLKPFGKSKLSCNNCKLEYQEMRLGDIPSEKIIEQRARYIKSESEFASTLFGSYLNIGVNVLDAMMSETSDTEIIESDAGQKEIDEISRKEREEVQRNRQENRIKEKEQLEKFRNLRRNDKCLCGSKKKFKKCCWNKIQNIQIIN